MLDFRIGIPVDNFEEAPQDKLGARQSTNDNDARCHSRQSDKDEIGLVGNPVPSPKGLLSYQAYNAGYQ